MKQHTINPDVHRERQRKAAMIRSAIDHGVPMASISGLTRSEIKQKLTAEGYIFEWSPSDQCWLVVGKKTTEPLVVPQAPVGLGSALLPGQESQAGGEHAT